MPSPDHAGAREYALKRLERELPAELTYHSLAHTRDDVVPAAKRLAELSGVDPEGTALILTAAWFHDIGFLESGGDHEDAAARIVREVLPAFHYAPAQVEAIAGMIMATKLPQTPATLLAKIVADADLDVLGRRDFMERQALLRQELEAAGEVRDDLDWFRDQVEFVEQHRYFTAAARSLRDEGKRRNLAALKQRVAEVGAAADT